jgi:hypothetical protein
MFSTDHPDLGTGWAVRARLDRCGLVPTAIKEYLPEPRAVSVDLP